MPELIYEQHGGNATVGEDGIVTTTRSFRYFSGNAATRPGWSIASINIDRYDAHPDDSRLRAVSVSSTPLTGELGWFDVVYTYSSKRNFAEGEGSTDPSGNGGSPGQSDPSFITDPTARTPVITYSENKRTVAATLDWDAPRKLYINSAGQPYEGQTTELMTGVLTVTFNRSAALDVAAKQYGYVNKLNDDWFQVVSTDGFYEEGTLRCNSWRGAKQHEEGYGWFTACTVEFEVMYEGWDIQLLDAGYYRREQIEPGVYGLAKILDPRSGQPLDAPTKLDGAGNPLVPGSSPVVGALYTVVGAGTPDVSVYKTFYPYEWTSFTNILS